MNKIFLFFAWILFFPSTVMLAENKVEISANNFAVTIEEAKVLDEETAKDENHAAVMLLNQITREYAIPFITVDEAELNTIRNANVGDYPLTFRIKTERYDDEKTIMVSILDGAMDIMPISSNEIHVVARVNKAVLKDITKIGIGILFIILLVIRYKKKNVK